MQRSITIERYKGMKRLEIPNLAPFTLIGGKNDIGKSSFLEAMFVFFDRQNPGALLSHLGWRNVGTLDATPDNVWEPVFYNHDTSTPIIITMVDDRNVTRDVRYRLVKNHVAQQTFAPFSFSAGDKPILQTQAPGQTALGVMAKQGNTTLQDTYVSIGIGGITSSGRVQSAETHQAVYLTAGRNIDAAAPGRLTNVVSAKKKDVLVEIARLIDDRIVDLSVGASLAGNSFVLATVEGQRPIPLALLGGGASIVINMALAILATPNGTILIDELETGIHHSALRHVIGALSKAARESNVQIIATTHSYECIKAAFDVFSNEPNDRFAYLRLERSKEGDVAAKVYTKEALAFAMNSEWEVR